MPEEKYRYRWVICGLLCLLVLTISRMTHRIIDLDLWHQLALGREIVRLFYVPVADSFAYVPTIPVVHHEWGAGLIAYLLLRVAGFPAIMLLNLALASATLMIAIIGTGARRAHPAIVAIGGIIALPLIARGFPPLRAQAYSFLLFIALLAALEAHSRGSRKWMLLWLAVFPLWVNTHSSFVLSFAVVGLYWLASAYERRTGLTAGFLPLFLTAMAALVLLNPYGPAFYVRTWQGVAMHREMIPEWSSIWSAPGFSDVAPSLFLTIAGFIYVLKNRRADLHGAAILLLFAVLACWHIKLLPYYGFAWLFYVPRWIADTPFSRNAAAIAGEHPKTAAVIWSSIALVAALASVLLGFWRGRIPDRPEAYAPYYPVGAVDFLKNRGFRGNLMTPFEHGAYVSWRLHPDVRVSMDSRYEAAYTADIFLQNYRAYNFGEWEGFALKYGAEAILTPENSPLASRLARSAWAQVYRDPSFSIYARPGEVLAQAPAGSSRAFSRSTSFQSVR